MQYQIFFAVFPEEYEVKRTSEVLISIIIKKKRNYDYINTMIYILKDLLLALCCK
jgi:hypothetical protein